MIARTKQVSYTLLGMIFGYFFGNIQGAFVGALIGLILSYLPIRRFLR